MHLMLVATHGRVVQEGGTLQDWVGKEDLTDWMLAIMSSSCQTKRKWLCLRRLVVECTVRVVHITYWHQVKRAAKELGQKALRERLEHA